MTGFQERFRDLRRRGFARAYDRVTQGHERLVKGRKQQLLEGLGGTVVEIGPGTGANLRFYDRGVRWTGIEPNPHMHASLLRRATQHGLHAEIQGVGARGMKVADASVDAVVCTLVLCSVDSVEGVLRDVLRVLKPGGRFLFLEHVGAQRGTPLRLFQRSLCPMWRFLADGCHPDRDTGDALRSTGFAELELEAFRLPLRSALPVAPHICGTGIR